MPNLNSVINLQSQMNNLQLKERAKSIVRLKKIAWKAWREVTPDYFKKLYESMPMRMKKCHLGQKVDTPNANLLELSYLVLYWRLNDLIP